MKFQKVDTDILFEAFNALDSGICIKGRNGEKLLVSFIGTVEVIIGEDNNGHVADLYDAVQLPTGEIVGVDENNNVFSIHKFCKIHWGCYPVDFDKKLKTTRPCPKSLK